MSKEIKARKPYAGNEDWPHGFETEDGTPIRLLSNELPAPNTHLWLLEGETLRTPRHGHEFHFGGKVVIDVFCTPAPKPKPHENWEVVSGDGATRSSYANREAAQKVANANQWTVRHMREVIPGDMPAEHVATMEAFYRKAEQKSIIKGRIGRAEACRDVADYLAGYLERNGPDAPQDGDDEEEAEAVAISARKAAELVAMIKSAIDVSASENDAKSVNMCWKILRAVEAAIKDSAQ